MHPVVLVCICHLSQHHIHRLAVIVRSIVRQFPSRRQPSWLQLTIVRTFFGSIFFQFKCNFFSDLMYLCFCCLNQGSHQCSAELTPVIGRSSSTGGGSYPKQATSKTILGDISPYRDLDVLSLQMTEQAIN